MNYRNKKLITIFDQNTWKNIGVINTCINHVVRYELKSMHRYVDNSFFQFLEGGYAKKYQFKSMW